MARTMEEKNVGTYRTIVRTTYTEDVEAEKEWYGTDPGGKKGQSFTEIFGPYSTKPNNRNYSTRSTVRRVQSGTWPTDSYYAGQAKYDYVNVADQTTEHQELVPVLALNPSGTLSLKLDWVKYV